MLYAQFVASATAIGSPILLTGSGADPSDLLRIDAARGVFFVFWNDRRSGSLQGYVLCLDTFGVFGTEHLIDEAGFGSPGPFAYTTTTGVLLLWNTTLASTSIMAMDCDSLGNPFGARRIVAMGPLSGLNRVASNPRRAIIDRDASPPILLDEHGALVPLGINAAALNGAYHIAPDGTVVTVQDSSISYYHSLLDSLPYKTVSVSLPTDRFRGSEFVTADSNGRTVLGYCAFHVSDITGSNYYYLDVLLRPESDDGTFGPPVEHLVGFWRSFHHCYDYNYVILDVERIRRCTALYDIAVRIHVSAIWGCPSLPGTNYSRNDTMRIVGAGTYTGAYNSIAVSCPAQTLVEVQRLTDGYKSSVEVFVQEGAVRLRAPVATHLQNVPQLYPAFVVSNGSVGLSWLSGGQHVVAPLVAWDVASGKVQGAITELSIDSIVPGIDFSRVQLRPTMSTSGNRFLLTTKRTWQVTDDSGRFADSSEFRFYVPVGTEWRLIRTIAIAGGLDRLRSLRFASVPDQPNDLIGYQWVAADGTRGRVAVDAVDANGILVRTIDTLVTSAVDPYLVQVGPRELLLLQGGSYRYFDGDSLHPSFPLSGMSNPLYAPMLGSQFLRWSAYHSVAFILYDRNGISHHIANDILLQYDSPEFTLVQNSVDSGFAFVYGGTGGVHMIVVDKNMNVMAENVVVSETHDSVGHPVAVYVNDTLYVAWEDYRNGFADIYGRAIPFNMRAGAPHSVTAYRSDQAGPVVLIEPNPASNEFTIRLRDALSSDAVADVVDVYGVNVASRRIKRGEDVVTVDARTFSTGSYFVVVHTDRSRGYAHLEVVR